ncbi:MAG: alpha/beta hydrolase [SAR86 cluster bacterium]|uniref:Alpha/beta hydrolase n=1 Tax=SAR86 cluster bacterium TaxID=2030880 RepID=A0A2A4MPJ1_9GAMM|nr:MAG: alpha/beta hydrolase [SAR86 cluster bacterium]
MVQYTDLFFDSHDGLKLYARDYPASTSAATPASASVTTIICLPGLTRNCADFEELCSSLAENYRLLAVDFRGRGRSDYDANPHNYHPGIYAQDITSLMQAEAIDGAIFIGTSLGGLVAMTLAATTPSAVLGIVLNDVGPEVDPVGLARIRSYVSNDREAVNWHVAVSNTRAINEEALPGLSDVQWRKFTRRLYRDDDSGRAALNFDQAISVLFEEQDPNDPPIDLWPLFYMLRDVPLLVLRGAHSDILSAQVVAKMATVHPLMQSLEVKGRGHAPLLDEPGVVNVIKQFLLGILAD